MSLEICVNCLTSENVVGYSFYVLGVKHINVIEPNQKEATHALRVNLVGSDSDRQPTIHDISR